MGKWLRRTGDPVLNSERARHVKRSGKDVYAEERGRAKAPR